MTRQSSADQLQSVSHPVDAGFPPSDRVAEVWGLALRDAPATFRLHQVFETTDGERYVLKRIRRREYSPDRRPDPLRYDEGIARMEGKLRALRGLDEALADSVARLVVPVPLAGSPERLLFRWNDRVYHMSRFAGGKRPSYRKVSDVHFVVEALAALHRTGRSFLKERPESLKGETSVSLGEQMTLRLLPYTELLAKIESPPDGSLVWRLLRLGNARIRNLVALSESIAAGLENESAEPTVIHGDTHENNFLLEEGSGSEGRQCRLLDVESFRLGFGAEDLAVPLGYLARYRRYDLEEIESAMGVYAANAPLADAERRFLLANLVLPRVWFRAADRMLKEHRRWTDPKCLQRLILGLWLLRPTERFANKTNRTHETYSTHRDEEE